VLFLDARNVFRQVDRAHRDWTPEQIGFLGNVVRLYRGEEPDFTLGGKEVELQLSKIFGKKPRYQDSAGLCRVAPVDEIAQQGWSLNPGRYVGTALGEDIGEEEFFSKLAELSKEFGALSAQARTLEAAITQSVSEILEP